MGGEKKKRKLTGRQLVSVKGQNDDGVHETRDGDAGRSLAGASRASLFGHGG